jgi:hypothetical protein
MKVRLVVNSVLVAWVTIKLETLYKSRILPFQKLDDSPKVLHFLDKMARALLDHSWKLAAQSIEIIHADIFSVP